MKTSYSESIREDASLTIAVGRLNHIIAGIVGNLEADVEVKWDVTGPPDRRSLFVNLRYEDQASGASIDPIELDHPEKLRSKLRDLWGDLLEVRLDRIMGRLKVLMGDGAAR